MVQSPLSPVDIPDDVPLHTAALIALDMFADRIAMIDGITEEKYTFSQVKDSIICLGSALYRLGLRKGDIAAILSPNSTDYVVILMAVLSCGASLSTINPVYTAYEVRKHIEDSRPKFIFASSQTAKSAKNAASQIGMQQTVITRGHVEGCLSLDRLLEDDGQGFPENIPFNVKDDVAVIPYSSGTTGFPKGVMITHYNIVAMLTIAGHPDLANPAIDKDEAEDIVTICVLPFFHVYGMMALMIGRLLGGALQIILPRFEPERFLYLIEKYKVTILPLVPPLIVLLSKSPLVEKYDLSSVKHTGSGAAPLSSDSEEEFSKKLKIKREIRQGFGMTETTLAVLMQRYTHPHRPGSSGVPAPNCEAQIVDPSTGRILGPGERGELWAKGPIIMKGYLNKPEATRETVDSDGWLHTGDVAYYDEECNFYIVDRIKELIKYKGFQVAPAELESLLLGHPAIDDAAVIGVADESAGELPRAYVVRKSGNNLTEEQVKQFVADHVSSFKHLRGGVEFVSKIPKSQTGKILRKDLQARWKASKL